MKLPKNLIALKKQIDELIDPEHKHKMLLEWYDSLHDFLYATDERFQWIEDNLKIRDKATGKIIKWRFNIPQVQTYMYIKDMEEQSLPVRLVILKARQEGISTLIEGILFYNTTHNQGYCSHIIAHVSKASDTVFRMSKRFLAYIHKADQPATDYSNRKEILFARPLSSEITIDVANKNKSVKDEAGRSANIHGFHGSEVALWNSPEEVMYAVQNCISHTPNTMVVLESTAHGASGYFHDIYWKAKANENDYRAVFLGWNLDPRNQMATPVDFSLTPEEKELKNEHSLTDRQVYWRRWKIANDHNGDLQSFEQENPITDVEAFKTTGATIFSKESLDFYFKHTQPGIKGYLEKIDGRVLFIPDVKGNLTIWEEPDENEHYLSGGDVAEGLPKGDFSCAYIMNKNTGNLCASWHGHIDPDLFADELMLLYEFYNMPYAGVENNNHGYTVINKLKEVYPYLYSEWIEGQWFEGITEKVGWHTNIKTRRLMVDAGKEWIRDKLGKIPDENLLKEMTTFVRNDKGKAEAEGTAKDDRVMAFLITLMMYERCPMNVRNDYKRKIKEYSSEVMI